MIHNKLIFFYLLTIKFVFVYTQIDFQLCTDPNCEGVISIARVENAAEADDNNNNKDLNNSNKYLKLTVGDEIQVRAKDARSDSDSQLWYGEFNNQIGYFPKSIVREIRIFTDDLPYMVPSNFVDKELPKFKEHILNNEKSHQLKLKREQGSVETQVEQDANSQNNNLNKEVKQNPNQTVPKSIDLDDVTEVNGDVLNAQKLKEAEEQRKLEEAKRAEEEKKRQDELKKAEEERLKQEEALRVEEERRKQEAEKKKQEEENKRQEVVRKAQEELKRLEEMRKAKKAEEERLKLEAEKKAEEERLKVEAEKKAEEERLRLEAERKAEEERLKKEAERKAEEERLRVEAEKKIEEERLKLEAERKAEEERIRLEAERKAEEERLRVEAEKKAEEEKKAEQERLKREAEKKAEQERLRREAERKDAEEKQRLEEARKAEEEKLKRDAEKKAEEERIRLEDEKIIEEEKRRVEEIKKAQEELKKLEEARKAEEERKQKEDEEAAKKQEEEAQKKAEEEKAKLEEQEKKAAEQESQQNVAKETETEKDKKIEVKKETLEEHNNSYNDQHHHHHHHHHHNIHEHDHDHHFHHHHENHEHHHHDDHSHVSSFAEDDSRRSQLYNEQLEINQTLTEETVDNESKTEKQKEEKVLEQQSTTKSTPTDQQLLSAPIPISNKKTQQQMKIKNFIYSNKYCADLNPLKEAISHLEPYYSPFILMLPENIQLLLLESTQFLGISLASCLIILFLFTFSLTLWLLLMRKKDQSKMVNNFKLNQAIVELELTIKNLNFEKQTFICELLKSEKELEEIKNQKKELDERLAQSEETYSKNEEKERDTIQKLTKDYSNLQVKYENLCEAEKAKTEEIDFLKEEKRRIEIQLNKIEQAELNKIEVEKYTEIEAKLKELINENDNLKDNLMKNKVDIESYLKQNETLQHEISLRDKSIALLQNFVAKNTNNLPTINEDDDKNDTKPTNKLNDLMNVANLQMKIHDLEQQLQNEALNRSTWNDERAKYSSEFKNLRQEYDDLKKQYDESIQRVKRLETENKLFEELRVKDIERNVRKEFMLEAELKKKSSDAERAAHLLEQLRLKQERIQELEAQIARIERTTTSDRHNFEKQMHENRIVARKFEKEAEEAKKEAETARKEAKLWKEKYNEVEQYREKLIRPVPNKIAAYIQPIVNPNSMHLNQTMDSTDLSPPSKSVHESSVERERPPSASSNGGGNSGSGGGGGTGGGVTGGNYPAQMFNPNTHGISTTPTPMAHPMYMRGIPPALYRPPFPPVPPPSFLTGRMPPFDRNTPAPSPDMMSQSIYRLPGAMPPLMPPLIPNPNYPSPQL